MMVRQRHPAIGFGRLQHVARLSAGNIEITFQTALKGQSSHCRECPKSTEYPQPGRLPKYKGVSWVMSKKMWPVAFNRTGW